MIYELITLLSQASIMMLFQRKLENSATSHQSARIEAKYDTAL